MDCPIVAPLTSDRWEKGTRLGHTCEGRYLYTRVFYLERYSVFYDVPFELGDLCEVRQHGQHG